MTIRVKSLEEMVREVVAHLEADVPRRPVFTLLLGSGFSYPIIPTPTQMLNGDIAWWRFCRSKDDKEPFGPREQTRYKEEEIADFERGFWQKIHAKANGAFPLTKDGLPDLTDPESIGHAYQSVMADGLLSNSMRRQYLRDAIKRSEPNVNGAHIFLAGILEAQEKWRGAPFCRTIFTTNFDPLLQRSLQLVNKLYYMTDRPGLLEPPDDDESDAIHLIYTHGSVHRYELVNTGDQIDHVAKRNAPGLAGYFARHGVIVIGYSGWRDTTMDALAACETFDTNLYWCDIHAADQAATRLRPEVLEILRAHEKHAYYVPIPSADEAMRQLHRALGLGEVPKFILSPVGTVMEQLKSIKVPAESSETGTKAVVTSMAEILTNTLARLEAARLAFDDPSVVKPESQEAQDEVFRAFIAQLRNDALVAQSEGRFTDAIALLTSVIGAKNVPASDRAKALVNRGAVYGDHGRFAEEDHDYSAIIAMPDAPPEVKASAHYNRGVTFSKGGKYREAIDAYSAVIAVPEVLPARRAKALLNRGVCYEVLDQEEHSATDAQPEHTSTNNLDAAMADYAAVLAMDDIGAVEKAQALVGRAFIHTVNGRNDEAIADFSAAIEMRDVPRDATAAALRNRGWCRFVSHGDVQSLIDDSRKSLELDSSAFAVTNLALGLLLSGDVDAALDEYRKVSPADVDNLRGAIDVLETQLKIRGEIPGADRALALLNEKLAKAETPSPS